MWFILQIQCVFLLQSAQREIALWFKPEELAEWKPSINSWVYE
jgi:nucleoside-diphosphate kinase